MTRSWVLFRILLPALAAQPLACGDSRSTPSNDSSDPTSSTAPIAAAGDDQTVPKATEVTLDASESRDPRSMPITFRWTMVTRPAESQAELRSAPSAKATFVADMPGVYVFELVVNNGEVDSAPTQVTVTATNKAPAVSAGADHMAEIGQTITLQGVVSDADESDDLVTMWEIRSQPSGSNLSIDKPGSVSALLTPAVSGKYTLSLTANDGYVQTTDLVQVVVTDPLDLLPFQVTDAEYSRSLDSIIMVSSSPPQLHRYDAVDGQLRSVTLALPPAAVSVSPDGSSAAVAHDARISYVDLPADADPSVIKLLNVTTDAIDVVLGRGNELYVFPRTDQWEQIRTVNIETGVETQSAGSRIRAGTLAKLHPTQEAIYGANNGVSPSDVEKYDISSGTASYLYDSQYHGDHAVCGDLWISEDGLRIFTRCGNVFRATTEEATDMTYNGSLRELDRVRFVDHSSANSLIAVIPEGPRFGLPSEEGADDTVLQFYDHDTLAFREARSMAQFYVADTFWPGHGRFAFFNSDGSEILVILQADASAGLLRDHAICRVPVGPLTGTQ